MVYSKGSRPLDIADNFPGIVQCPLLAKLDMLWHSVRRHGMGSLSLSRLQKHMLLGYTDINHHHACQCYHASMISQSMLHTATFLILWLWKTTFRWPLYTVNQEIAYKQIAENRNN